MHLEKLGSRAEAAVAAAGVDIRCNAVEKIWPDFLYEITHHYRHDADPMPEAEYEQFPSLDI